MKTPLTIINHALSASSPFYKGERGPVTKGAEIDADVFNGCRNRVVNALLYAEQSYPEFSAPNVVRSVEQPLLTTVVEQPTGHIETAQTETIAVNENQEPLPKMPMQSVELAKPSLLESARLEVEDAQAYIDEITSKAA